MNKNLSGSENSSLGVPESHRLNDEDKKKKSSNSLNNNYMQFLNFDNESNMSGSTNDNAFMSNNLLKTGDFLQQKMFEDFMMKQNQGTFGFPLNSLDFPGNNSSLLAMMDSPNGNNISSGQNQSFLNSGSVPNMSISNSLMNPSPDHFNLSNGIDLPLDMNFNPSLEHQFQQQPQQNFMLDKVFTNEIDVSNIKLESPKSFPMSENVINNTKSEDLFHVPTDTPTENHFENLPSLSSVTAGDQNYWRNCIAFVENVAFGKDVNFSKADFIREQDKIKETTTFGDTEYADYIKVPDQGHIYNIVLGDLPTNSRVETQIKLQIGIEPAPLQNIIHLSSNGIPRRKYLLQKPVDQWKETLLEHVLFLETHIIKSSDKKKASVCDKCCKREERRFSRRKSGNTDADLWAVNDFKEALIFNTKQLSVLSQANVDLKSQKSYKNFTIPCRFVCYCRHHKETVGFRIVVLLKNAAGDILAKKTSQPLKIVNYNAKSKSIKDIASDISDTASSVASESSYATDYSNSRQSSVDYSTSSYQSELDNVPLSADQLRSMRVINNLNTTTADLLQHQSPGSSSANLQVENIQNHYRPISNNLQSRISESQSPIAQLNSSLSHKQRQPSQQTTLPIIYKIIPNSGPLSGGVEVTILGENFTPNTQIRFGVNKALTVNFWGPTTIVATAPPASFPGPVQVVGLLNEMDVGRNVPENSETRFTYIDQNDKELLELALQIVDLEVNGSVNGNSNTDVAENGSQNIVKRLIREKQQQQQQQQPYSQASTNKKVDGTAALQPYKVVLSLLGNKNSLKHLDLKNKKGHTLLHLASLKSHIEIIIFLISNGASVNVADKFGYTPLHFACLSNDIRVIKMLIAMNCDKYSPTFTKDLMTPLELFLNNYDTNTSEAHDEVYDLLKDNKKLYSTSVLDDDSMYSNGSGYQVHISTMVKDESLLEKHIINEFIDVVENKNSASPNWKNISKESSVPKNVSKASANGSTTSGMTANTTCEISIDSHPPLYDDLFPDTILKRPSEEFKTLNEEKLMDYQIPKLLTTSAKSLLPAIDPESLNIDQIDTTDMEENIMSVGSYNNNESTDTESFGNSLLAETKNGEQKKKSKLNAFNEDLLNNFKLMKVKQKDFLMDTKLLFFWIPFLLILVSIVIILSLSSTDENSFTDSWNIASNSVRTKLANLFLGRQRWQSFVKDAIHQGEMKFKEAFNTDSIQNIF